MRTLLMGAFGDLSVEEKANQTAAGYHHTYFHAPDLDTACLMQWPTDLALQSASLAAFQEVEQLLGAIGINATDMLSAYTPPAPSRKKRPSDLVPEHPKTLLELMTLYADASTSCHIENEIETCGMAVAADDVDKTVQM